MDNSAVILIFQDVFPYLMILSRMVGLFVTAPAFGESYIPGRIRMILAIGISLVLIFPLLETVNIQPANVFQGALFILGEVFLGVFMGLMLKVMFSALHFAGSLVGYHGGLMNAFVQDPNFGQQAAIPGVFLMTTATFLIFATNIHHEIILSLIHSYERLPVFAVFKMSDVAGDMAIFMAQVVSTSFLLGVQLASPFIILGTLMYAGMGVINRLMPQIQVIFIVQPLQIFFGLLLLALTLPMIFPHFLERFSDLVRSLWTGG